MTVIEWQPSAGMLIQRTIDKAIHRAKQEDDIVQFEFNGVTVQVAGNSNPGLIYRDWKRGLLRPSDTFVVEPYPPKELSANQRLEDVRLKVEDEAISFLEDFYPDSLSLLREMLDDWHPDVIKSAIRESDKIDRRLWFIYDAAIDKLYRDMHSAHLKESP